MEELYDTYYTVAFCTVYRSMEELHQQRMERMEELYDNHILTIKRGIEEKLRDNR